MLLNNKEGFVSFMADPFFVPFQFVKWPYFFGSVTIVLRYDVKYINKLLTLK